MSDRLLAVCVLGMLLLLPWGAGFTALSDVLDSEALRVVALAPLALVLIAVWAWGVYMLIQIVREDR